MHMLLIFLTHTHLKNCVPSSVQSTWNNVGSVNSGGWADVSAKLSPLGSVSDREKSSGGLKTSGHRTSEPLAWAQESEGEV